MLFLVTRVHSHTFQLALSHVLIAKNCYDSGNLAQNYGLPTKDSLPQGNQLKWLCVWQFSNCGLCMWVFVMQWRRNYGSGTGTLLYSLVKP